MSPIKYFSNNVVLSGKVIIILWFLSSILSDSDSERIQLCGREDIPKVSGKLRSIVQWNSTLIEYIKSYLPSPALHIHACTPTYTYACCGWAWCSLYFGANPAFLGGVMNKEWVTYLCDFNPLMNKGANHWASRKDFQVGRRKRGLEAIGTVMA